MNRKHLIYNGMSVLFALVLLLCAALPVMGGEGDPIFTDAVFTVGNNTGEAGEKGIEIPVTVEDSPTFSAIGLQFTYDTSALTLTGIVLAEGITGGLITASNLDNGILLFEYLPVEGAFPDDEVFILTFDISEEAFTGDYPIGIALSDAGWANWEEQELTGTFEAGYISVTGQNGVALYGGVQYETLQGAIDAADLSGEPGTVKLLDDITIEAVDNRIIIPNGAEITLDMNGHTVTSSVPVPKYYDPVWSVEVVDGASLNLVSTAEGRGKFVHDTCPEGSAFLLNGGTLNMSDVDVENFYYGVYDGSKKSGVEWAGTYGTFENCDFTTKHRAFFFGKGSVEAIKGCHIEVTGPPEDAQSPGWLGVNMAFLIAGGEWVEGEYVGWATLDLLEDTYIEVNDAQDAIQVGGRIETIKNCTIVNNDEPYEVEVETGQGMESMTVWPYSISLGVGGQGEPGGFIGTITDTSLTGTLSCGGTIGLIEGDNTVVTLPQSECTLYNWHTVKVNGNTAKPAYIGAITGGTFEGAPGMTLFVGANGSIGSISGGEFSMKSASTYYPVWVAGGSIGNISGGLFDGGPQGAGFTNQGTIGEISGAKFISVSKSALYNSAGTITTISGGEFASGTSSALNNTGTVGTINGGEFTSDSSYALYNNVGIINTVSGGAFIGPAKNGICNYGGTIGSISGGAFQGSTSAIYNTKKEATDAKINSLSGGYYKNNTNKNWINGLNQDCEKPTGYDFASVSLRPLDLPQWFPEELEVPGFYHFGETVDVTWKVEGTVHKTDKFVKGDPVYFAYDEPESEAGVFRGWSDGDNVYGAEEELPLAAANITYEAQFAPPAEDYLVSLEAPKQNINAGEEFTVDVVITSDYNEDFFGATIEVGYDSTRVDYKSAQLPDGFGLVEGNGILQIVGASGSGYAMTNQSYKIATLKFEANSNVSTGEALFSIKDDPIVNQEDAVYDQVVPKGENLTLDLWNLQVTFQAGDHVTMDPAVAYVKYNEAGLWTSTTYSTVFTEPMPVPADHYTLDDPVWKPSVGANVTFAAIQAASFTADAVYTANASPSQYGISYPEEVAITSGVTDGKVTYLTDVVFTVTPDPGYRVKQVSYTAGTGDPGVLEATDGVYTIPGNEVTGDISISVVQEVDGTVTFISNDDFLALPMGYKVLLLTVESKLTAGAYKYDGNAIFYSSAYSGEDGHVYVYVVPSDVDEGAAMGLLVISESGSCVELSYDGDVNLDTRYNSTDAVLIYGLYKGVHAADQSFTKVSMRMRLEADVNGDKAVNTADAQAVLNKIWGTSGL